MILDVIRLFKTKKKEKDYTKLKYKNIINV